MEADEGCCSNVSTGFRHESAEGLDDLHLYFPSKEYFEETEKGRLMTKEQDALIKLLSVALASEKMVQMPCAVNWKTVMELANRQEVNAIAFDGYKAIHDTIEEGGIPKFLLMEWLGQTVSLERKYKKQYAAAVRLAELYDLNFIRTFVLKGFSIACCYPVPSHRFSCDLDCYLSARCLPNQGSRSSIQIRL